MANRGESSINSYNILVGDVRERNFYTTSNVQVPYTDKPTEFLFESDIPNRVFGVFVNDVFKGTFTSNFEGLLIFKTVLPQGQVTIQLVDDITDAKMLADLADTKFGTWLGAVADTFGEIERDSLRVKESMFIEKVNTDDIESNFGQFIACPRISNYTLDVYRELLLEVFQSFNTWSATYEGLANVVAAFTQIRPLIRAKRKYGPRWVLGFQHLYNRDFNDRFRDVPYDTGFGVDVISASGTNAAGIAQLQFTLPNFLQYQSVGDSAGPVVDVSTAGTYTLQSNNGYDTCTVTTTPTNYPIVPTIINVYVAGLSSPDHTTVLNATSSYVPETFFRQYLPYPASLRLQATGANPSIQVESKNTVLIHLGEVYVASFWVTNQMGVPHSFVVEVSENGGPWVTSTAQVVGAFSLARVDYDDILSGFGVSTVSVRLRSTTMGAGDSFLVQKAALHLPETGALYLGHNTIPRSRRSKYFGHTMLLYSPEAIEGKAYEILGIVPILGYGLDPYGDFYGSPVYGPRQNSMTGLTNFIIPTYVTLSFFQNTLENSGGIVNAEGVMYEDDWRDGTRTNFTIVPRNPDRFSHLVPSSPTKVEEVVTFNGFTLQATLSREAIQDQTRTLLTRNGEPMPNTSWSFITGTTIQLASLPEYDSTAEYVFRYDILIRFESGTIDLGVDYPLFNWFADWYEYNRVEHEKFEEEKSEAISVSETTLQATLSYRAIIGDPRNRIFKNNGALTTELSPIEFRFLDETTVQIDPVVYDANSVYFIEYVSNVLVKDQIPEVTVEVAYSDDDITYSSWIVIQHDTPFGNKHKYWKFRVTVDKIKDVRDYKLRSLTMKGDPLRRATIETDISP